LIKANSIANKYLIKNIEFICGDIEKLSFENETIDTITSNGVFSLLPNLMHTFEEVFRILKNNGQFCF
jgi:ubiquinone/menaquinone biosynthesis C-methylase UbiE